MFQLALKHLLSRKRQSLMTLLGIMFGSMAFICISGIMLGFRFYLIEQLVSNDPHIKIKARESYINEAELTPSFFPKEVSKVFWAIPPSGRKDDDRIIDVQGWYRRIYNDSRVKAFSPVLNTQGLIRLASSKVATSILGVDAKRHTQISNIHKFMEAGNFADLSLGGNRIILGSGLIKRLGGRLGQTVLLSAGTAEPIPFKIIGIFKTGIMPIDEARSYASLSDVQRLNGTANVINEIGVNVKNLDFAAGIATQWQLLSNEKVQSWDQANESFFSVFRVQDAIRYLMIGVILIVAAFGIYNIMNMTVNQKKREIAILRSMGYESWDITYLFLIQGIVLGTLGGLIGLGVGFLISKYLETIPFGGGAMGGTGKLIISYDYTIYLGAFVLGLLSSAIASAIPARAAGQMQPIEIIRAGAE